MLSVASPVTTMVYSWAPSSNVGHSNSYMGLGISYKEVMFDHNFMLKLCVTRAIVIALLSVRKCDKFNFYAHMIPPLEKKRKRKKKIFIFKI